MDILRYIERMITADHVQLAKIASEQGQREDTEPPVGLQVGRFLGLLVRLIQAQRVLEFGSCLGYSAIWLAEALRVTGGRLTSVEINEEFYRIAQKNLAEAELSGIVELIQGDASTIIDRLKGPFDLILQDSGKTLYQEMLDRCIALTRKGGLIIADDALFKPMGVREELSRPVHLYNRRIASDDRLYSTILPIGDGLAVSVKVID